MAINYETYLLNYMRLAAALASKQIMDESKFMQDQDSIISRTVINILRLRRRVDELKPRLKALRVNDGDMPRTTTNNY